MLAPPQTQSTFFTAEKKPGRSACAASSLSAAHIVRNNWDVFIDAEHSMLPRTHPRRMLP